jgi:hypothetical protein
MNPLNGGIGSNIMDGSYNELEYFTDIFLKNPVKML